MPVPDFSGLGLLVELLPELFVLPVSLEEPELEEPEVEEPELSMLVFDEPEVPELGVFEVPDVEEPEFSIFVFEEPDEPELRDREVPEDEPEDEEPDVLLPLRR